MPTKRSKPAIYRGVGLEFDWRPFDAATVERLIAVTRFPAPAIETGTISYDDVLRVLNSIAIWWKTGRDAADAPTDKMLEDALQSLAKALRRACELMPIHVDDYPWTEEPSDDPRLPPRLAERLRPFVIAELRHKYADRLLPSVPDSDTLLTELAESLNDLSHIVFAATSCVGEAGATDDAAQADLAELSDPTRRLVQSLTQVYSALFEREVRLSRTSDRSTPSGPLLRFLHAALQVLHLTIPDETLVGYVRPIYGMRYDTSTLFATAKLDDETP